MAVRMDYIKEGLDKLAALKIPFLIACPPPPATERCIRVRSGHQEELRNLGFRVGKKLNNGDKVVFYKGSFFGLTTG